MMSGTLREQLGSRDEYVELLAGWENGMTWEPVCVEKHGKSPEWTRTDRLKVAGGFLYRTIVFGSAGEDGGQTDTVSTTFVPAPPIATCPNCAPIATCPTCGARG